MNVRSVPAPGFTLIELMITVAAVAILAAIAYPSYTDYIRKGKRATAQAALMDLASKEQGYLLDRRAYTDSLTNLAFSLPSEIANDYTLSFPAAATAGQCTGNHLYVAGNTPPTFCVQATPSAALAARGEQPLTIDDTGTKTPASTSGYWGK
jgi:type IV pilus assembly protein PilE